VKLDEKLDDRSVIWWADQMAVMTAATTVSNWVGELASRRAMRMGSSRGVMWVGGSVALSVKL
jgi:hypothetical protein